jgi:hypothetical protein
MGGNYSREAVQRALRRREELEAALEVVCTCEHRRRRHQMNLVTLTVDCLDCEQCPDFEAAE